MMDKQSVVHPYNEIYYSVLKRKEILTCSPTWMNPEDIIVNEKSQTQKDKVSDSTHVRSLEESNP